MAQLSSPGVDVTVNDTTVGGAGTVGTTPLVFIATAQDKLIPGTNSVAVGTKKENAGKLYLATSPKNLSDLFGTAVFQESSGTIVQGDELNEYGLHALETYLGLGQKAYVVRANIDTHQLKPTSTEPTGAVRNGTMWFDTFETQVEGYISSTVAPASFDDWERKPVYVIVAENVADVDTSKMRINDLVMKYAPSTGELAVYKFTVGGLVTDTTTVSAINQVPTTAGIWIRSDYTQNGALVFGTRLIFKRYSSLSNTWTNVPAYLSDSFYGVEFQSKTYDTSFIPAIATNGVIKFYIRSGNNAVASTPADTLTTTATKDGVLVINYLGKSIGTTVVKAGEQISVALVKDALQANVALFDAGFDISVDNQNKLVITSKNGVAFKASQSGELIFADAELAKVAGDSAINYSLYNVQNLIGSQTVPSSTASIGTLWFDFAVSDGLKVSLKKANAVTNMWEDVQPTDVYVQTEEPQIDRQYWVKPLTQGVDGYEFYRLLKNEWSLLDVTDQSTLNGITFLDFSSDNVPSANLYMNNMLACDMSQTEGVVKVMTADGWRVASGNNIDGSGAFGRFAQRKMIVAAINGSINSNEAIRSEFVDFNLIAAPSYLETLSSLITLNLDRRETAFIVTDIPSRLVPDATVINDWCNNAANAPTNGEFGRTTRYDYAAQYMGWGMGTDYNGNQVMVPSSTIALRTYAYNDSVSYVWMPPAGKQRGVVSIVTSIGHLNDEMEYQVDVPYSRGLRDVMYTNAINPITPRPGSGILVYGDKTLAPDQSSALSRVNVARLVVYIRRMVEIIAESYLFRLNTATTRQDFASQLNAFLSNLYTLGALYDFVVVCDESNNTPDRIDRNELWADIAIQPVRSINFIYVPIRVERTNS